MSWDSPPQTGEWRGSRQINLAPTEEGDEELARQMSLLGRRDGNGDGDVEERRRLRKGKGRG